jgi:pimeloyl-ACP methyl ester carboxylesterase
VRFPATGPAADRLGTLILNPGGPGQSGVGLSKIVYLLPESVRARFDFVTYDPRGIGASTPALEGKGCNIAKPTRPATGKVDWDSVLAERQEQVARDNARCFEKNRTLVEHAGTVDGAYDLDALREAVGDEKITYWGISYGSLVGSTYAQLFPDRVRAMVFDGNMNPQTTLAGISEGSVAPDDSIGFFLQATGLRVRFDEVMAKLNRHTIELPDDSRYTRWDLLDVLNDGVDFFPITGDESWAQAAQAVNVVGGIHGTFGLSQSDCVDNAIGDFLISVTPPAIDVACPYSPRTPHPEPGRPTRAHLRPVGSWPSGTCRTGGRTPATRPRCSSAPGSSGEDRALRRWRTASRRTADGIRSA